MKAYGARFSGTEMKFAPASVLYANDCIGAPLVPGTAVKITSTQVEGLWGGLETTPPFHWITGGPPAIVIFVVAVAVLLSESFAVRVMVWTPACKFKLKCDPVPR